VLNSGSDLREIEDIYQSKVFRQFLARRKAHFQEKVNQAVQGDDMREAYANKCLMHDQDRILEVLAKEIGDANKGEKQNG
jgi:hypothetical protein